MSHLTEIEKQATSNQNLQYSGDVTIKVTDGDRTYSDKTFHNAGCIKLFNFLADCLAGDFNYAKSSRPCRIVLFNFKDGENEANLSWDAETCVSTKVFYDSAVTPGATMTGGKAESTITYHFRIPYLCLTNGAVIRKIGLYPDVVSDYYEDLCAYFVLAQNDAITVPTSGGNFTVIIDWKLHIKNK